MKLLCLGYALITMFTVYIFEMYVHRYMAESLRFRRYGLTYNAIHVLTPLVFAGTCMAIYTKIIFGERPYTPGFWKVMGYTFLVGIIPTLLTLIWNYSRYLQRRNASMDSLNTDMPSTLGPLSITIKGSNTSDTLSIEISKIILGSANGNYITLHYLKDDRLQRHIIRKTLSALTSELDFDNFLRCHKSHLVNMSYVLKKEGNSKGLKLTIDHIDEQIQVGRMYIPAIRDWYSGLNGPI